MPEPTLADRHTELFARVSAVLVDLRAAERRCRDQHYATCLCGALAARIRTTLTGEDTTDAR